MIANFDEVSRQLKELATVINTFKSEAVQLRIIEIVLAGGTFRTAKPTESDDLDEKETKALGNAEGERRPLKKSRAMGLMLQKAKGNPPGLARSRR